ncbi:MULTISPECIES: AmpG family muropeptide MFS transporter [Burkholderiaceae]|jgi:MFS transporter, PAT family, beta-lactamase induction signal transducer AmpG|uniref:AmpG permease n=1 Tax=Caballeronia sordidicola TaxID=196367 RepID=A0A242MKJ1_CABSO|nr:MULTISPECIES: AmpG family muropeptide MFS transporter [Burkholderiaceae]AME23484.1 AmpG family muropeptide MFS transporter [Burkholderia sp. PAMC 26561]MDP9154297.1 AmpG family muropeptide MFS transporter [Pseudomonadota bacterium]OTP71483.1 AmpG permease [Caballeronia sordidicola]OTP75993.1 AmpG permease [Caballeronia sordidicola]
MSNSPNEAPALTAHEDRPGWRAFLNKRMLICVFLGFTSGLPLFTLIYLVQAWLRTEGVNLKEIGLFALIQFPYTWKFIWAPLMDRYVPRLPGWHPGRRRGWMIVTQLLVGVAIGALGFISPKQEIWTVAALTALVAFFGASQDIAIDAYRRELLADTEQGLGNAVFVNAYKIAALIPGSLGLILADHLPWSTVFMVTAAFMLPGVVLTLVVKEPEIHGTPPKNLRDAIVDPFKEFIGRDGWRTALLILGFIFLYKLGDSMATTLSTSFFLDIGFNKTQIGVIAKTVAFWASIAGGIVGGMWLVKIGIGRGLWIFGVLQIVSTLGFAWLAKIGPSPVALATLYGFETFATGLTTAAFVAYIASTTDPRYTATQFALFTSLASVPRTLASASSGFIVAQTGWFEYFMVCVALSIPGMLLLPKIAPWRLVR